MPNWKSKMKSSKEKKKYPQKKAPPMMEEQLEILKQKAEELEEADRVFWEKLPQWQKCLPKVELHAHLSGSLPLRTIIELIKFHEKDYSEVRDRYEELASPKTGLQVFEQFPMIHKLLQKPEGIKIAMRGMIASFAEEGCIYMEIRTTPKRTRFMDEEAYLRACIESIESAKPIFPTIKVFLVVSIDRCWTIEEAAAVMRAVSKLQQETNLIVGIDICGRPDLSALHLLPMAVVARTFHGLGVTVHLGELQEHMDEVIGFLKFKPDRIGHGTFLHTDQNFVKFITEEKIPIEVCLTSNVTCKTVPDMFKSHAVFWWKQSVPISINTDDQGIMPNCSISREYARAIEILELKDKDVYKLNTDALNASFANLLNVTDMSNLRQQIAINYINCPKNGQYLSRKLPRSIQSQSVPSREPISTGNKNDLVKQQESCPNKEEVSDDDVKENNPEVM